MIFEIYQDKATEFRWRLKAVNGQIVADSGEGYTRHEDALRAAMAMRRDVARAKVKAINPQRLTVDQPR